MINIRIKFSASICAVVFFAVFFRCGADVLTAYLSALIHELAHWSVCVLFKVRVYSMKIGALGIRLNTERVYSAHEKILISIAGPLMSFLLFASSAVVAVVLQNVHILYRFAFLNLCIALINSLPLMPLDGGVILKSVLIQRMGIIRGQNLNRKINAVTLVAVSLSGIWGVHKGYMSVSLIFVVLFLLTSAQKEAKSHLLEKQAVLSGNCNQGRRIRYIYADSESSLLNLAAYITHEFRIVAGVFENGRFIGEIDQTDIIHCMNTYGVMYTVGECLNCKSRGQ